jgi:hypothetical protein
MTSNANHAQSIHSLRTTGATSIFTILQATACHAKLEHSVLPAPDFVKIAPPANTRSKLMPTLPIAPNAPLGGTNLPVAKTIAWIVRLENIKPKKGCRIVCLAFLERTKTNRGQPNVKHAMPDNTKMLLEMLHVYIAKLAST